MRLLRQSEPTHGKEAEDDEGDEHSRLRSQEWWLGLRRGQRLQEWQLLKGLHDSNEDIKVQR
jgi:hypothetical protein